jgi:hypothetical protein
VDEIVNTIRGLGEKVEEPMIVQNVLRSLPLIFDAKVSTIEEMKDLDSLTMDELHGIRERRARSMIRLCLTYSVLPNVSGEDSTNKLWDKLESLY